MERFDVIIIGGGPGGYQVAAELAADGQKVALFERDKLGGTCLNRGCIPTKCLCATASRMLMLRGIEEFGISTGAALFDLSRARLRARKVVDGLRNGITEMLRNATVINAEAALNAKGHVVADGKEYDAERILIASGSRPAMPPIPGIENAITSDTLLESDMLLPKSIIIVGGGVIGIEFASLLNAMGSEVTVVEYCKEILPQFDADIAKRLRMSLQSRGVKFALGASVNCITADKRVQYSGKRGDDELQADVVLVATGRRPVLPKGLAEAGIKLTQRGFIEVGPDMQTSRKGIYAAGDVTGLSMLAHAAEAQARIALITGPLPITTPIPSVVFSEPEVALVGLTPRQCKDRGMDFGEARCNYASNGKALADGEAMSGIVKLVYDKATGNLLGVHAMGSHAADLIAEGTALIAGGSTIADIRNRVVHAHPSYSELLSTAAANAR